MTRSAWLFACLLAACSGLHEVEPGVWRSPQVGEDRLARRIEHNGIRTVVCLRGGEGAAVSERATLGTKIAFRHVLISARHAPPPEALLELWDIADRAERPLLVHCRAGADRTGLACAIVVLHDTGDLAQARGQLALIPYGHTGLLGTDALDDVLDQYELHAASMPFPDWVRDVYANQYAASASQKQP
jgi:protein tyrosine phosphatase (PTP) superfamily phosphohydrolase (DUF442 family)